MKKLPKFKNEDEEREFWKKNDSTKYLNWARAKKVAFKRVKGEKDEI